MAEPKRAFCYTRVSTDQQNTKVQAGSGGEGGFKPTLVSVGEGLVSVGMSLVFKTHS